jgi:hypothetical protein
MARYLILTSITGGKDDLIPPAVQFDDCDYLAFVDQKFDVPVWEQREAVRFSNIDRFTARRNAKVYKILASSLFPQYEYIVWQDGNHHIAKHPREIVAEYGDFDLLCFKHPDRNCCYDEILAVAQWRLDEMENLVSQAKFYAQQSFPKDRGLFELSTFVRRTSPLVREFEHSWWEQICKFSSRDQTSFPYLLWRYRESVNLKVFKGYANLIGMKGPTGGNEYFTDAGRHKA